MRPFIIKNHTIRVHEQKGSDLATIHNIIYFLNYKAGKKIQIQIVNNSNSTMLKYNHPLGERAAIHSTKGKKFKVEYNDGETKVIKTKDRVCLNY